KPGNQSYVFSLPSGPHPPPCAEAVSLLSGGCVTQGRLKEPEPIHARGGPSRNANTLAPGRVPGDDFPRCFSADRHSRPNCHTAGIFTGVLGARASSRTLCDLFRGPGELSRVSAASVRRPVRV